MFSVLKTKKKTKNPRKPPKKLHPASPRAEALKCSMTGRFGVGKQFVLVFWRRGLLLLFSGGLVLVEMHLQGAGR